MSLKSFLLAAGYYLGGCALGAGLGWFGPLTWDEDQTIAETNQSLQALWKEHGRVLKHTDPRVVEVLSKSKERTVARIGALIAPLAALLSVVTFVAALLVKRMRIGDPILFSSPFALLALFFGSPAVALLPAASGVAGVVLRHRRAHRA